MFDSIVKVGTPIMAVAGTVVGTVSLVKEIRDNKKAKTAVGNLTEGTKKINNSLYGLATNVDNIKASMAELSASVEKLKEASAHSDAAITSLKMWNDAHLAQFHGMAVVPAAPAAPVAPVAQTK